MARTLIVVMAALLLLTSCARPPAPRERPAEILAWWIEDTARGIPRRPGELALDEASERFRTAARWAVGDDLGDRRRPPASLATRINRWPGVAAGLANGLIRIQRDEGLLGPEPRLSAQEFALAAQLADAETGDRLAIDVALAALLSNQEHDDYLLAVRQARRELDQAAGGEFWTPNAAVAAPSAASGTGPSLPR
jgi:hypothetical protein